MLHEGCVPAGASSNAVASGSDPSTAAVVADVDLVWQEEDVSMVGTYIHELELSVPRLLPCVADLHHRPLMGIALSVDATLHIHVRIDTRRQMKLM